jgi:DNA (cytosine-5)-methyltransferase 1
MKPTVLDLFSGIGGFTLAFESEGFDTVAFCEKDPYAQKVLIKRFGAVMADAKRERQRGRSGGEFDSQGKETNESQIRSHSTDQSCHRNKILHADIFTLNGADYSGVSVVTGGFPCQPFSTAGKRRGAADDRHLWPEMFRVIGECRPSFILAENVPGIVNMELDRVLSDLEGIGYWNYRDAKGRGRIVPLIVPACAVDARHRRSRVWILAHATGSGGGSQSQQQQKERASQFGSSSEGNVADAQKPGLEREISTRWSAGEQGLPIECCQWLPEPAVRRMVNGISHRSHRLRCLGNAVVPQVVQVFARAIRQQLK